MLSQIIAIDDEKEYLNLIREYTELSSLEPTLFDGWNDDVLLHLKKNSLLFLDIHMPTNDGMDILMRLNNAGYKGGIVVLSGAEDTIINSVLKLGESLKLNMHGHLPKPFLLKDFRGTISRFGISCQLPESDKKQMEQVSLSAEDLSNCLSKSWLYPVYQPQVDLNKMQVVGIECLSRMKHPEFGVVPPPLFIDYLTQNDLIGEYTLLLMDRAFIECDSILKKNSNFVISFNISALSLNQSFTSKLFDLVEKHQLNPSQITIEITETNAITLSQEALYSVTKYRAYGFNLSVDDFGTGYSTIMQLNELPFNELKIDKSFIDNISQNDKSYNIVKGTILLATSLSLNIIAEGVETEKQLQLLQEMGCTSIQGYIFSKPLLIKDLHDFINDQSLPLIA